MAFTNGPIFTTAGKELHARAIAGAALKFTKMQMGDGTMGGQNINNMTALIHPVASVEVSALKQSGNFATVCGLYDNTALTAGFYWREIGLFAADPDAPDDRTRDILYCYQNAGTLAEFIPASSSELISKRINMVVIVDDAVNVSATLAEVTMAMDIVFDNTNTDLDATDVQAAIEELAAKPGGVTSVNGKTGAVTMAAGDVGAYSKTEVDEKFDKKYVVTSVNKKSGIVTLTASDVGAYTKEEVDNKVNGYKPTLESLGAAAADHNHDGKYAPVYTYGKTLLTPGVSPLATGRVHFVYE